jgi:hypothetical protein
MILLDVGKQLHQLETDLTYLHGRIVKVEEYLQMQESKTKGSLDLTKYYVEEAKTIYQEIVGNRIEFQHLRHEVEKNNQSLKKLKDLVKALLYKNPDLINKVETIMRELSE